LDEEEAIRFREREKKERYVLGAKRKERGVLGIKGLGSMRSVSKSWNKCVYIMGKDRT
jgi:hypothetical protein